ncbi:hypothetical protein JD969_09825 [Planctomycetota bacterium]|nr:hypothetical protein JD969_09825 [Planctomycetota bacterium]
MVYGSFLLRQIYRVGQDGQAEIGWLAWGFVVGGLTLLWYLLRRYQMVNVGFKVCSAVAMVIAIVVCGWGIWAEGVKTEYVLIPVVVGLVGGCVMMTDWKFLDHLD